jgi:hypothetical protein
MDFTVIHYWFYKLFISYIMKNIKKHYKLTEKESLEVKL